ncbi:hypothetical protein [Laspinema olomoucense]|uniref:hypothetical protein n=1 Tax=Laspinema olomoucense TaxID=3231600 RepID=UPI0021BA69D3|nr:hypothetical protein [Laspinema sp. D3d]MCT7971125.1 hypothetical protein [Laspinema sp. D3d]
MNNFPNDCDVIFNEQGLTLLCDSVEVARNLLKQPSAIATWAVRLRSKEAFIKCPVSQGFRVFRVPVCLAEEPPEIKPVVHEENWIFSGSLALNKTLIQILNRMLESERPMALVEMVSDRQLWINEPMQQLLETPATEATQRCMKDFWLPGDLELLKQRCHQETKFVHHYEGGLNPQLWADLSTEFELIEAGDKFYRLATNLDAQPKLLPIKS